MIRTSHLNLAIDACCRVNHRWSLIIVFPFKRFIALLLKHVIVPTSLLETKVIIKQTFIPFDLIWLPDLSCNSFYFFSFSLILYKRCYLNYENRSSISIILPNVDYYLTHLISLQTEIQTWTSNKCTNREWTMKWWTFLLCETRFGDNTFPSHAAEMYFNLVSQFH